MSIKRILRDYKEGKISLGEAEKELKLFDYVRISDWGNVDILREHRTGAPEVIFGEDKRDDEVLALVKEVVDRRGSCIVTRLNSDRMDHLSNGLTKSWTMEKVERAGIAVIRKKGHAPEKKGGRIAILCAGTSDVPHAEEARIIAEEMGCVFYKFYDVGVAGIHRLIPAVKKIVEEEVDAVVVAAGMEGALPSVVAGLIDVPVIGLPISTGYGIGGKGEAALLSMLQSCAPGLATVNIDNGVGAGVVAALIANRAARFRDQP
ncbi:MAG: nickel pincer cofactor biosynthesis protein LarB [Candidatus Hydrothermarchaeaceae archaeon]